MIEKSVPRDHRLSSLGKPRDAKRRSSERIFLSYLAMDTYIMGYLTNDKYFEHRSWTSSAVHHEPSGEVTECKDGKGLIIVYISECIQYCHDRVDVFWSILEHIYNGEIFQ